MKIFIKIFLGNLNIYLYNTINLNSFEQKYFLEAFKKIKMLLGSKMFYSLCLKQVILVSKLYVKCFLKKKTHFKNILYQFVLNI